MLHYEPYIESLIYEIAVGTQKCQSSQGRPFLQYLFFKSLKKVSVQDRCKSLRSLKRINMLTVFCRSLNPKGNIFFDFLSKPVL